MALSDPKAAWSQLNSGKRLTAQESETYLDVLFQPRVLASTPPSSGELRVFRNLANALVQNHHDYWLRDFLAAPFSGEANLLLASAISEHDSDVQHTRADSEAAEKLYIKAGNIAGAAWSQNEMIYAERRLSHSAECLGEINKLQRRIRQRSYIYIRIVANYESSNCQTMHGDFNRGRQFAELTNIEADKAHYPSLALRARSLLSAIASTEGGYQTALRIDSAALAAYWDGSYAGKRGFQFYSDAGLTAGHAGQWHLAAALQREAIATLEGTRMFDFQATAHLHRGIALRRIGEPALAQEEFNQAFDLLRQMKDPYFLLAYSYVELAGIEMEQGDLDLAESHLKSAEPSITKAANFLVELSYYNALADLERQRNHPEQEWNYIRKTIAIAQDGFRKLSSVYDRWEWYREVDRSFHRLIELELEFKHDPQLALADWEAYRAAEIDPAGLVPESAENQTRLATHLKSLHSSSLVSFIVFPKKLAILVADDHGVRVVPVAVDAETLRQEAAAFLHLCSDQNSSLQKVKEAGSRLYKRLLQPIEKEFEPGRRLVIEADGFLSRVPWAALVADDGKYLAEKYMTVSTPGLFFTPAEPSRKKAVEGRLVVYPGGSEFEGKVYPPLPQARREARYVAQVEPGSVNLPEEEATADGLLQRLPRASAFHFAGHAINRKYGGELLLSGKETLSAAAIQRLDLSGMDRAVLSACSTAEADSDIARSPNGLVEAFLSAGAHEVVATRWDVGSAESLNYMEYFASEIAKSNDGQKALRIARDRIRSQNNHPYAWAAFDIFGNLN